MLLADILQLLQLLFSRQAVSDSLQPHRLQHACFPVFHYLPEFAQSHVHWVNPTFSSSIAPYLPVLNLLQHQGVFWWVSSSHQVAKYWSHNWRSLPQFLIFLHSAMTLTIFVMCVLVPQECPTLCNTGDCSLPGSSVLGIPQARMLEWVTIYFSRPSSWPRGRTQVYTAGRFFTIWATRGRKIFVTSGTIYIFVFSCYRQSSSRRNSWRNSHCDLFGRAPYLW